jgi:hypothetical protein
MAGHAPISVWECRQRESERNGILSTVFPVWYIGQYQCRCRVMWRGPKPQHLETTTKAREAAFTDGCAVD